MVFARRIAIEQATEERHECYALELRAATRLLAIVVGAEQGLEPMRVPQRFRRQRRDDLTEPNVALGERLRLTLRPEEDRADDRRPPPNRHDDDRAHVANIERRPRVLEHWIVRRIRDEHRVARLECPLELRVPIEVDDEVPDRRILVARDEAHIGVTAGEVDRASIEPERLTELASDGLENVYEMQRRRNVLEDVDNGDELVTLALKLRDPLLQPGGLRSRRGITFDR